jgi:transketolase
MTYPSETVLNQLEVQANQLRRDVVEMIYRRQNGHPGGSLSAAEIMTALFFNKLHIDPHDPKWAERDRFLLSKGHASAMLYAALARRGFFPVEDLWRWGHWDCHLQGHPDRLKTPGVEMTSGLLGHGVSIGAGLALGLRLQKLASRVYVLLGDGEIQAGIVWEGAMLAAKYRLSNLTAILDYNDIQLDGSVHDVMPLEPLVDKWRSFNWHVLEVNGHNLRQVIEALDMAGEIHHSPTIVIAHTTKGKGVSFMENKAAWHGLAPNPTEYQQALLELQSKIEKEG